MNEENKPASVPFIFFESEQMRAEHRERRLAILCTVTTAAAAAASTALAIFLRKAK